MMQETPSLTFISDQINEPVEAVASVPLLGEDNGRGALLRLAQSELPGTPTRATGSAWPACASTQLGRHATGHGDPISPVLTISEAAGMLGISSKRMQNLIAEEKARLGRLPDFVVDAGGRMRRRIIKDQLIMWLKARKVRRGRPPKMG